MGARRACGRISRHHQADGPAKLRHVPHQPRRPTIRSASHSHHAFAPRQAHRDMRLVRLLRTGGHPRTPAKRHSSSRRHVSCGARWVRCGDWLRNNHHGTTRPRNRADDGQNNACAHQSGTPTRKAHHRADHVGTRQHHRRNHAGQQLARHNGRRM